MRAGFCKEPQSHHHAPWIISGKELYIYFLILSACDYKGRAHLFLSLTRRDTLELKKSSFQVSPSQSRYGGQEGHASALSTLALHVLLIK